MTSNEEDSAYIDKFLTILQKYNLVSDNFHTYI